MKSRADRRAHDSGGRASRRRRVARGLRDIFLRNTWPPASCPDLGHHGPCAGGAVYPRSPTQHQVQGPPTCSSPTRGDQIGTHESDQESWRRLTHGRQRRGPFRRADDRPPPDPRLSSYCRPTQETRRGASAPTDPDQEDEALDDLILRTRTSVRHEEIIRTVWTKRSPGVHEHYARNLGRLRAPGRRGGRGWPTSRRCWPGRSTSTPPQGARFVRFCDAFNVPAGDLRGRPRFLPAPTRAPRIIKHGATALCLRGGDRAEGHRDHAQVLRRRLLRDGSKHIRNRFQLRLPERPRSRHGPRAPSTSSQTELAEPRTPSARTEEGGDSGRIRPALSRPASSAL